MSFFSGALGLDQGLERAGLNPLAFNECDSVAVETIKRNRPNARLYATDIRDLNGEILCSDLGVEPGELFLVCGGPPCQAFSTAGRRLGLADERGNVFLHFVDLIGQLAPRYVLIENVRGLLSSPLKHRPHSQRGVGFPPLTDAEQPGGALRHIVQRLQAYGYTVSFNLYNAANFGVPQIRERLILFGAREGDKVPDLYPTHDIEGRFGLDRWLTVGDVVRDLPPDGHEHLEFPEKRKRFFQMLGPGQNWKDLPPDQQLEAMGRAYYSGGGKTGFFRRLAWDKPSPTLVTCPTMPATDLCHPEEARPLSVQEYARLQTFPDEFEVAGTTRDKYRQLGNAVPCRLAEAAGKHLVEHATGRLKPRQSPIPLSRYKRTSSDEFFAAQTRQDRKALPLFELRRAA